MKANTPELMKFKRLQRRLNVTVAQLAGHLELLWIATAKNAPEGDIGRFSNEDIAIACYWESDPDIFVNALIECGWLDASDEWRLLVHDWAQHAPTYVHGGLKRHGRKFRTPISEPPKEPAKEPLKETPIGTSPEDTPTKPSQVKPSLTKPSEALFDSFELAQPASKPEAEVVEMTNLKFPLCDGSEWVLSKPRLKEFEEAFPEMDVGRELLKCIQWLRVEPKKRKTKVGIEKCILHWLSKGQNQGTAVMKGGSELSSASRFAKPKVLIPQLSVGGS